MRARDRIADRRGSHGEMWFSSSPSPVSVAELSLGLTPPAAIYLKGAAISRVNYQRSCFLRLEPCASAPREELLDNLQAELL